MNKRPSQEESIQWIKENMLNKIFENDGGDNLSKHIANIDINLFDEIILDGLRLIEDLKQQLFDKENVQDLFLKMVLSSKAVFFTHFERKFNTFLKEVEPFMKGTEE